MQKQFMRKEKAILITSIHKSIVSNFQASHIHTDQQKSLKLKPLWKVVISKIQKHKGHSYSTMQLCITQTTAVQRRREQINVTPLSHSNHLQLGFASTHNTTK